MTTESGLCGQSISKITLVGYALGIEEPMRNEAESEFVFLWRCWEYPQFSPPRDYPWPLVIPCKSVVSFHSIQSGNLKISPLLWNVLR